MTLEQLILENMDYKFKNITPEKVLAADKTIIKNGGTVYKDNTFEIMGVKGGYKLENGTLLVKIVDKPWLASWGMIEKELNKFFN